MTRYEWRLIPAVMAAALLVSHMARAHTCRDLSSQPKDYASTEKSQDEIQHIIRQTALNNWETLLQQSTPQQLSHYDMFLARRLFEGEAGEIATRKYAAPFQPSEWLGFLSPTSTMISRALFQFSERHRKKLARKLVEGFLKDIRSSRPEVFSQSGEGGKKSSHTSGEHSAAFGARAIVTVDGQQISATRTEYLVEMSLYTLREFIHIRSTKGVLPVHFHSNFSVSREFRDTLQMHETHVDPQAFKTAQHLYDYIENRFGRSPAEHTGNETLESFFYENLENLRNVAHDWIGGNYES